MKGTGYTIEQFPLGPMANFAYVIIDHESGEAAVVDPAWDADAYHRAARLHQATITQVILTHSHDDHVNALEAFQAPDMPIRISRAEADFWRGVPAGSILMSDGEESMLGETTLRWLITPGHTPGSACLLLERDLIAADTMFVFGCGRCDLEGSDPRAMHASLARLAETVSGDIVIHPGHDYGVSPSSTLREQIEGNPFMMFEDVEAFVKYRMQDHGTLRSQPFGPETSPYPTDG